MKFPRPYRFATKLGLPATCSAILACMLTLGCPWPTLADTRVPDKPYKKVVGEFVLVMLFPRCEREPSEALMTPEEFEGFRKGRRQSYEKVGEYLWSWSGGNVPGAESCLHKTLGSTPRVKKDLGDAVLVDLSTYRPVPIPSVQSTTGEYYPASGLYRNDGSVEPLWTVDWYAGNVLVSSDGVHVVRVGPWAGDFRQLAVAFYKSGRFLAGYSVADLVANPRDLIHSVSNFGWRSEISFDDEKKQLFVATRGGDTYLFNVADGQIKALRAFGHLPWPSATPARLSFVVRPTIMIDWTLTRHVLGYSSVAVPILVIVLSFTLPGLRGMRFALYPVWWFTQVPLQILLALIPGVELSGLIHPDSPIKMFEVIGLVQSIVALPIAYIAVRYYLRTARNDGSAVVMDSIIYFLAILLVGIPFGLPTHFMDLSAVLRTYAGLSLPVLLVAIIWFQNGALAPTTTASKNVGTLMVARFLLSAGILVLLAAHSAPAILWWVTGSGSVVFGGEFLALLAAQGAIYLLIGGLCLYEYIRFVESRPNDVLQSDADPLRGPRC